MGIKCTAIGDEDKTGEDIIVISDILGGTYISVTEELNSLFVCVTEELTVLVGEELNIWVVEGLIEVGEGLEAREELVARRVGGKRTNNTIIS